MALHVYDGDRWSVAPDLATAQAWANDAISALRDMCDPEWPDSVESVSIYEAPDGDECPDEGRCVMRAVEFDRRDDPTGCCDYWCDYRMEQN